MEKIYKIFNVELTENDCEKIMIEKKYIVTYSRVIQLHYSVNAGYYGTELYYHKGLARKGRFHLLDCNDINRLIGFDLVLPL